MIEGFRLKPRTASEKCFRAVGLVTLSLTALGCGLPASDEEPSLPANPCEPVNLALELGDGDHKKLTSDNDNSFLGGREVTLILVNKGGDLKITTGLDHEFETEEGYTFIDAEHDRVIEVTSDPVETKPKTRQVAVQQSCN